MCRAVWVKRKLDSFTTHDALDPDGFDVYVQWLYGRYIPAYDEDPVARLQRLTKAHLVADTIKDSNFQQDIRKDMIQVATNCEQRLGAEPIVFVYKMTTGSCALREFFVDLYILKGDMNWFKDSGLTRVVLIDLSKALLERAKLRDGDDIWTFMTAAGHINQEDAGDTPAAGGET